MPWRLWWINTLTFLKVSYAYRRVLVFASNMFGSVNSVGKVAHSSFLSVLVEVGLIGFALFGITLTIAVIQGLGQPKWDSGFWLSVLLVWGLGVFFAWEPRKQKGLFLSLVIVSANLSVRGDESSLRSKFPVSRSDYPKEKQMKQMTPPLWLVGRLVLGVLMVITGCLSGSESVEVVSTPLIDNQDSRERAATASSVPAFPGAEGFGANSVGGRGGRVIEVTNLDDSGPGSLRAAIEADRPRTVVFRVGGTIELQSGLEITNPFITIAGQTAPGGGITLRNDPSNADTSLKIETHDVVIRYIRSRPGPSTELHGTLDAITIGNQEGGTYNVIVDHSSFSWATDEVVNSWYDAHDITIQWSIVSEGLHSVS